MTTARPKPPRINSHGYVSYQQEHGTIRVRKMLHIWNVMTLPLKYQDFPTHAEAIAYASRLARERGEVPC